MKTIDLTKESRTAPPLGLRYEALLGDGGGETRALWEQVFTEDTAAFLDYYYKEKIIDARIHVLKDQNGQIVSMVHENPYDVMMHGVRRRTYYMVGVATAKEYRHRGCMAFLLQKAVLSAKREGCPFVFLMPADAAIYEPFGFRYDGQLPIWERSAYLKARMAGHVPFDTISVQVWLTPYSGADAEALAAYAEKALAKRFDTYCVHDEAYFDRLNRELISENGGIYLLWKREHEKDALCGYFCYACEEEESLQEVIVDREAEVLFYKKSSRERIMFLALEETCPYGRTYFPEIV